MLAPRWLQLGMPVGRYVLHTRPLALWQISFPCVVDWRVGYILEHHMTQISLRGAMFRHRGQECGVVRQWRYHKLNTMDLQSRTLGHLPVLRLRPRLPQYNGCKQKRAACAQLDHMQNGSVMFDI